MKAWMNQHPNLASWAVLALGMLVVLAWSARDVDLTGSQRAALGGATVLLAGICAWIISWESDGDGGGDGGDNDDGDGGGDGGD